MRTTRIAILGLLLACVLLTGLWALWLQMVVGGPAEPVIKVVVWVGYILGTIGTLGLGVMVVWGYARVKSLLFRLDTADIQFSVKNPLGVMDALQQKVTEQFSATQEMHRDVESLRIQTQLLQRQKRQTEAIIYSLREAVMVMDDNDRLLLANDAAGHLFGFDCRSHQFDPITSLLKDHEELVEFLFKSHASRVQAAKREIHMIQEGLPSTHECIVSCVTDEDKTHCGIVAVLHDVTREKEVSQIKNDFISYVSHELKTPLASISAYAEMLLDGEADNETMRHDFYQVIQGQASRLNRLIEDILNVSRIESGLMKMNKQRISLAILVEEQMQMIRTYAEERRIHLIGHDSIVCDQVYADKDMISQVIINLLSNAVKYNCPGGTVSIETEVDENASLVRLSVTDTGIGIEEEELQHVFDKFYRVSQSENRAEGTGLGLNLVKQIVEGLNGGRVFARSQIGVGSTFGFELPLATQDSQEQFAHSAQTTNPARS